MTRLNPTTTTPHTVLSTTKANLPNAKARRRRGMKRRKSKSITVVAFLSQAPDRDPLQTDELKRALKEAKRSPSTGAVSPTGLIPRPRDTSSQKDLQLRLKMRINDPLYKEIRVRFLSYIFRCRLTKLQGFVRILIKKSNLNRTIPLKHQRSDEVHKIFMVVCPLSPSPHLFRIACLILCSQAGKKYPVLNKFECNWVTAAMIQGCLKNFRGRTRRSTLMAEPEPLPNPSSVGRRDMGVDVGRKPAPNPEAGGMYFRQGGRSLGGEGTGRWTPLSRVYAGSLSRSDIDPGAGGGSDPSGNATISRPPPRPTSSGRWDSDID